MTDQNKENSTLEKIRERVLKDTGYENLQGAEFIMEKTIQETIAEVKRRIEDRKKELYKTLGDKAERTKRMEELNNLDKIFSDLGITENLCKLGHADPIRHKDGSWECPRCGVIDRHLGIKEAKE